MSTKAITESIDDAGRKLNGFGITNTFGHVYENITGLVDGALEV